MTGSYYYGGTGAESRYLSDVADGNLAQADESTTYKYDAFGHQTEARQNAGGVQRATTTANDACGRTASVSSPEGTVYYAGNAQDPPLSLHGRAIQPREVSLRSQRGCLWALDG